jgi:ATP-dependent DNA helicase RecG
LEGTTSISLRDRLFREVVSNLLIHRAYSNAFPAKLIIEKDRVYTENWSHAHGWGLIDPQHFTPFPKNPTIAKFFKEIGKADELGSGVRNVFRYGPAYAQGALPELVEGDVFKTIIPLKRIEAVTHLHTDDWENVRRKVRSKFVEKFGEKFVEKWEGPLELIFRDRYTSATAIAGKTGISARGVQKQLARMKDMGIIERIGADKGGYWKIIA